MSHQGDSEVLRVTLEGMLNAQRKVMSHLEAHSDDIDAWETGVRNRTQRIINGVTERANNAVISCSEKGRQLRAATKSLMQKAKDRLFLPNIPDQFKERFDNSLAADVAANIETLGQSVEDRAISKQIEINPTIQRGQRRVWQKFFEPNGAAIEQQQIDRATAEVVHAEIGINRLSAHAHHMRNEVMTDLGRQGWDVGKRTSKAALKASREGIVAGASAIGRGAITFGIRAADVTCFLAGKAAKGFKLFGSRLSKVAEEFGRGSSYSSSFAETKVTGKWSLILGSCVAGIGVTGIAIHMGNHWRNKVQHEAPDSTLKR